MAREHDKMINKLLAMYLEEHLHEESLKMGGSDLCKVLHVVPLNDSDFKALITSARKKLKQLSKSSEPLSDRLINWREDFSNG